MIRMGCITMRFCTRMRRLVRAASFLVLGIVTLWLTACSDELEPVARNAKAVVARPDAKQIAYFDLLSTPPEGLPARIAHVLRQHPMHGLNWTLAQKLPGNMRQPFWIIPGKGTLCILTQDKSHAIGLSCRTTADAVLHGVAVVTLRSMSPRRNKSAGRLIVGLAPNQAQQVLVQTGRSQSSTPIRRHVFVVRDSIPRPPSDLTFR
jgi:hypothetical protein